MLVFCISLLVYCLLLKDLEWYLVLLFDYLCCEIFVLLCCCVGFDVYVW